MVAIQLRYLKKCSDISQDIFKHFYTHFDRFCDPFATSTAENAIGTAIDIPSAVTALQPHLNQELQFWDVMPKCKIMTGLQEGQI